MGDTGYIKLGGAYVYSRPITVPEYIIGEFSPNKELPIIGYQEGFYQISPASGLGGWVHNERVEVWKRPTDPDWGKAESNGTIQNAGVGVKGYKYPFATEDNPTSDETFRNGEVYVVLGEVGNMYEIKTSSGKIFINKRYIKFYYLDPAPPVAKFPTKGPDGNNSDLSENFKLNTPGSEWGAENAYIPPSVNFGTVQLKPIAGYFYNASINEPNHVDPTLFYNNDSIPWAEYWVKFDRFYTTNLDTEDPSGRHYIFICRPDLNFFDETTVMSTNRALNKEAGINADHYFQYLARMHPEILGSLTGEFIAMEGQSLTSKAAAAGSGYGNSRFDTGSIKLANGSTATLTNHAFIPYLTTRIETMQLPDYSVKVNSLVQPYTKYSIPYSGSGIESTTGGQFDIEFREDKQYSIHKLFYAWTYYQSGVMKNLFKPKKKYIQYNAIDYATSIYDFIVDDTGENIIYWSKYTGCIPNMVPMSDMSFNKHSPGANKVNITFSYFVCEHMDRMILVDFQYNSIGYITLRQSFGENSNYILRPVALENTMPIYEANRDSKYHWLGNTMAGRPVIIRTIQGGKEYIKLRWLEV